MAITPLERPGVQVIQEFVSANPTILIPTLPACIVGPAYQIVEGVQDDGTLNPDALIVLPARLTGSFVSTPFEYTAVGGDDLVLRVNNAAAEIITLNGSGNRTVTQLVDDINTAAIPGLLALVETSGTQQRPVLYTTNSGDQSSLQVDNTTDADVLAAFGFTAGYTARGWSGYNNYFNLRPLFADYPDPRDNLSELSIDYDSVRVFINDGAGNVREVLKTESFLRGATSAVSVQDDGDSDNLSPYLNFAGAVFADAAAVLTGTVDWTTLTYPTAFGVLTLDIVINGTPIVVTFSSPANVAAAISQFNAAISAQGSVVLNGSNQPVITSNITGVTSRIEIGNAGTINETTIGLVVGRNATGSPSRALAQGIADISALVWASVVHDRVLRMSINGDAAQTLVMPDTIGSAANVVTAINGLWGAGVAAVNEANQLVLRAPDTNGGIESAVRIDKDASDALLLSSLGLTGGGAPFNTASAVYGSSFEPAVGDDVWVDGMRLGEITEIPASPTNRLRIDTEQLLTFSGSTWYVVAKGLDNSLAGPSRPGSDLVVDENTGTVRIKNGLFRETAGDVTTAGPLSVYMAYTALRQDVSRVGEGFNLLRHGSTTTLEAALAPLDTQNPLGLGMYLALLNAPGIEVAGLGVEDASSTEPEGTLEAYVKAFEYLESKDVYAIAPLTHASTVGQIAQVHVDAMSEPENGLERFCILNPERPTRKSNTLVASGATANVTGAPTDVVQTGVANLQALLAAAGFPGPTYTEADAVFVTFEDDTANYLVQSVSGGAVTINDGPLSNNTDGFFNDVAGGDVFDAAVVDRPFTVQIRGDLLDGLTEEATAYGEIAQGYSDRRVIVTVPDQAKMTIDGLETLVDGFYLGAGLAGKISSKEPQQPITEDTIAGFTGVVGSSDRYGEIQLKIMSGGGLFIFYQAADGTPVKIRQQLTSDMSTIQKRELSILTALDFVAKFYRVGLRTFIGKFNLTTNVRDAIAVTADGLKSFLLRLGVVASLDIVALRQSESAPDELEIDADVGVHYPVNRIRVTMKV